LVVRAGKETPVWSGAVVDVRVDHHPEPLRELRRQVELARVYRDFNMTLARLAAGDHDGAVEATRRLSRAAPADPYVRMRLGLALLATGDAEGRTILAGLAAKGEQWLIYSRRSLEHYGIAAAPLLGQLDE
jgi:predicted Zn-dependent protease